MFVGCPFIDRKHMLKGIVNSLSFSCFVVVIFVLVLAAAMCFVVGRSLGKPVGFLGASGFQ